MKVLFFLQKGGNMKSKSKNEIRYHSVNVKTRKGKIVLINHPAFIFKEKGNMYIYVTITHSNTVKNYLVIKLNKNPNPNDLKESFWVAEIREDDKNNFGKRHNNWKMAEEDIKAIVDFYEKEKR